jgi:DNA-binding PadR family transcriptional regulator
MSETALLSLVFRYSHPGALARRVSNAALYDGLRRLELAGYVTRRRGLYRVTARGRKELTFSHALHVTVRRALAS